ncbi:ANM_HP_G0103770.mRNA.1.CDS.1 [Saccharomyces cerevisiae]|nr:ANM_HP_G0103770.mRNA.1.CDS.1 [Saccharomyces cerevisiae]CAI6424759.1 ANM_HP_G0103770.mRNA.1.CDS.1 [Saccharomyces cerevisiae]
MHSSKEEDELEVVADSIERELILLGGTAIEDRLQDGVPDCIELFAEAGIKLWVLRSDKLKQARNIGFSCNLLNNEMELLVIKTTGDDVKEFGSEPSEIVDALLSKYLKEYFNNRFRRRNFEAKKVHEFPKGNYAIVIDGDALKAVLCCRVSPSQKAAVVKLVKDSLDVMTLAIGDGSNDVAMIQSADAGIGIAGEEGRQAVMCPDYAIGQFRYLARLVLVHGRWSYKRLQK